jgi:sensor histidine kinase regulating citrate/malate metabolism
MFWVALGLGAGATGAVLVSRWLRRQTARLAPASLGAQLSELAEDTRNLLRDALDDGRIAMREREAEIRAAIP